MMTDTIRLIQFTDMHLIADPDAQYRGFNTQQSFDAVIATAQQDWPPDGILLTGDLVQDEASATYHRLAKQITEWQLPVYCLPGNHDATDLYEAILPSHQVQVGGNPVLHKNDSERWHLIMLDTSQAGEVAGCLSAAELTRLDSVLQLQTELPTLIAMHHPPVLINSAWMDAITLLNANQFWQIVNAHQRQHGNIKGIVCGHIHQELATQQHGIPIWGTPSTCRQFKPFATEFALDDSTPGYRYIELSVDQDINTRVVRIDQENA